MNSGRGRQQAPVVALKSTAVTGVIVHSPNLRFPSFTSGREPTPRALAEPHPTPITDGWTYTCLGWTGTDVKMHLSDPPSMSSGCKEYGEQTASSGCSFSMYISVQVEITFSLVKGLSHFWSRQDQVNETSPLQKIPWDWLPFFRFAVQSSLRTSNLSAACFFLGDTPHRFSALPTPPQHLLPGELSL